MPCFNHIKYVAESIKSVLDQTERDLELIIVDDASADASRGVIKNFRDTDSRVKSVLHTVNSGASAARNSALKIAAGDYIAFCDADDIWKANKLETQLALLENYPSVGVVYGDAEIIDEVGRKTGGTFNDRYPVPGKGEDKGSGFLFKTLAIRNFINIQSALVRRDLLPPENYFDSEIKLVEDWWFWIKISRLTSFLYDPAPIGYYRINSSTLPSANLPVNRLKVYSKVIQFFPERTDDATTLLPPEKSEILYHMGVALKQCGKSKEARDSFFAALKYNPINWRAAARVALCTLRK